MEKPGDDPRLSAQASDALEHVWARASGTAWEAVDRDEVRRAAAVVGAEARDRQLLPEQLVILIKKSWSGRVGPVDKIGRRPAQTVLSDVLARCIDEYFGGVAQTPQGHDERQRPADTRP